MINRHLLDRPVWNALRTRQSAFAIGCDNALRMFSDRGHFAAAADLSAESSAALFALIPTQEQCWVFETDERPSPIGAKVLNSKALVQMLADGVELPPAGFDFVELTDADAFAMQALAERTRPGPFLRRTHQLGNFIGVMRGGRLVAMAGERLKVDGFTEVSAVCTLPDQRGHGLAGNLVRIVANRIAARGETAFLHALASNAGAIALYERLGFARRRNMTLTILGRTAPR